MKKTLIALMLLLCAVPVLFCSCKKEEEAKSENDGENTTEDAIIDVSGDGEDEEKKSEEAESEDTDTEVEAETEKKERSLNLDQDPTIAPEFDNGERKIRVWVKTPDTGFEDGIDVFYFDGVYEYYFEQNQSDYTFVSIDDGQWISVINAVSNGSVTIEELQLNGLDIKQRLASELATATSIELTVVYCDSEEGMILGTVKLDTSETNISVYAENIPKFSAGETVYVDYVRNQLVENDEEISYTDENGEERIFTTQYKIIEAEILID